MYGSSSTLIKYDALPKEQRLKLLKSGGQRMAHPHG
ncbi:MAG: hypothetical protein ACLTBF_10150 [Christensenellales bacterium]